MNRVSALPGRGSSVIARLSGLTPLDGTATAALVGAESRARMIRARRELVSEGQEVADTQLIVHGWAARVRLLPDGRRQLLSFLLPGDLVGHCHQPRPLASSTVVALTDLLVCTAPPAETSPTLERTYAISHALDEAYLLSHIARLGRFTAEERIADLLLELLDRLTLAGLARGGSFELPLTQEALADALGLTSVHVNRMLQLVRRRGDLTWKSGRLTLADPALLASRIGRMPVRVCLPDA